MTKNMRIADNGASNHMKNNLKGMVELKDYSSNVKMGSRQTLRAAKIGKLVGVVKQKDGSEKKIISSRV